MKNSKRIPVQIAPKFKLRDPNATKPTSIRMLVYVNRRRIFYNTQQRIDPRLWSFEDQMPVKRVAAKLQRDTMVDTRQLNQIRTHLAGLIETTQEFFSQHEQPLLATQDELRAYLDGERPREQLNFRGYYQQFIADIEGGVIKIDTNRNKRNGEKFSKGTIANHRLTLKTLEEFGLRRQTFEQITQTFMNRFTDYLEEPVVKTRRSRTVLAPRLDQTTRSNMVATIRSVMNRAYIENLHDNREFLRFSVRKKDKRVITITRDELKALEDLELEDGSLVRRTRDLFLIGYYTCQRFSDYRRLRLLDVKDGIWRVTQQKTGKVVRVPLHEKVLRILEQYDGYAPELQTTYRSSIVSFNQYIKRVARQAGLDRVVDTIETYDPETEESVMEELALHEVISSHTCRRSGATHLIKEFGAQPIHVQQLLGHSEMKQTEQYLDMPLHEMTASLQSNKFFTA